MEKYFCRTSVSDPILVTVCEKATEHKVLWATVRFTLSHVMTPSHGIKPDSSVTIKKYPDFL